MKIRNAKKTLLILIVLVFLSFSFFAFAQNNSSKNIFLDSDQDGLSDTEEKTYGTDPKNPDTDGDGYNDGAEVKSSYNPLKPAPGDKIIQETTPSYVSQNEKKSATSDEDNLTKKLTEQLQALAEERSTGSPSLDNLSAEELQKIIDQVIAENVQEDVMPDVLSSEVKIKKQDYSKLSEEDKKKRKEDDFITYVAGIYYVFSSNSPEPLTSGKDLGTVFSSMSQQIIKAITARSSSGLEELANSGENMLEQMREIEVPEELADVHIQAIRMAKYAQNLKNYVNASGNDPMGDATRLSKINDFLTQTGVFSEEISKKFEEYGITYDDAFKKKLEEKGVELNFSSVSASTTNSDEEEVE